MCMTSFGKFSVEKLLWWGSNNPPPSPPPCPWIFQDLSWTCRISFGLRYSWAGTDTLAPLGYSPGNKQWLEIWDVWKTRSWSYVGQQGGKGGGYWPQPSPNQCGKKTRDSQDKTPVCDHHSQSLKSSSGKKPRAHHFCPCPRTKRKAEGFVFIDAFFRVQKTVISQGHSSRKLRDWRRSASEPLKGSSKFPSESSTLWDRVGPKTQDVEAPLW